MKKIFLLFSLLLPVVWSNAQVTDAEKQLKTQVVDSVEGWKSGGMINLNLSQTSLTNWAAGGQSSIAMNGLLNLHDQYKKGNELWENYLDLAYGSMKQGDNNWWKTDDKIAFVSKYGHKAAKNLYIAGLIDFRTQFSKGYNYPNDSVMISRFMASGYLLGALGAEYRPSDNFDVFIAPFTGKFTFVMDNALSDSGAFGVKRGEKVYSEFGGYARIFAKKDLMENISIQTNLDLFSNYLHNPGNIDISWKVLLSMKVNKFFSATISTDMIYDDDIKIVEDKNNNGIIESGEKGPRLQFKEVLAIGLAYKF
jgi:hypothetical protein